MRLITDQKLVNRNLWIGKYSFYAGMALLVVALIVNFMALRPENQQWVVYAFAAFLIGFTLTNVGTFFNNRWGRRPDKGLADALRGLDDRYTLYNYRLGAAHVLVGPGIVFGADWDGFVRLAWLLPDDQLVEGLARMAGAVRGL